MSVRHAYQNAVEDRTAAWRNARYQRSVVKGKRLLAVVRDPHATQAERSAAIVEFQHAIEEQESVLAREARR